MDGPPSPIAASVLDYSGPPALVAPPAPASAPTPSPAGGVGWFHELVTSVSDVAYGHAKWWEAGPGLAVASYAVCSIVASAVRIDEARAKAESERLLKIDQQLAQELQAEEDTEGRAARMRCTTAPLTFACGVHASVCQRFAEWNLVSEAYESCVCVRCLYVALWCRLYGDIGTADYLR